MMSRESRVSVLDMISNDERGHWRFESGRMTSWRHADESSRRMWA